MKNMNKNIEYIKNVKPEEIDWIKLFGSYSCGKKIGKQIKKGNLLDLKVLKNIESEIEHQSTLWTLTPFVMIFLTRELEKEVGDKKEEFYYLLGIYKLIVETLNFNKMNALGGAGFETLEVFPEMKEIFNIDLSLEEFDNDEEAYIEACYEEMTDIRYSSCYYYTELVVQNSKGIIEKLLSNSDEKIKKLAQEIIKML